MEILGQNGEELGGKGEIARECRAQSRLDPDLYLSNTPSFRLWGCVCLHCRTMIGSYSL